MTVHRLKVLILNENTKLIEQMVEALASHGVMAQSVSTIREAKKIMGRHSFDVLVTDVTMPEDDGIRLSREVCSQIPIVLLKSGEGGEVMARKYEEICNCFIDKSEIKHRLAQAIWKAYGRFKIDRKIVQDLKMAA